jgi:hypothetical protein
MDYFAENFRFIFPFRVFSATFCTFAASFTTGFPDPNIRMTLGETLSTVADDVGGGGIGGTRLLVTFGATGFLIVAAGFSIGAACFFTGATDVFIGVTGFLTGAPAFCTIFCFRAGAWGWRSVGGSSLL